MQIKKYLQRRCVITSYSIHYTKLYDEGDCLAHCAQALGAGKVVAIKGLGGFHLAVDGCSESTVRLLRERKHRPAKPLAIMVRDLDVARRFCRISEAEATLLQSP